VEKAKFDAHAGVDRSPETANPRSAAAGNKMKSAPDIVTTAATVGVVVAGVALFEAALLPGVLFGAAAVLAPKLRRRLQPVATVRPRIEPELTPPNQPDTKLPLAAPGGFAIKQALAKTITFQSIVTTLDFGAHYVVVGDLATAASLSASHLTIRPLYYLVHESAWNYLSPPVRREAGLGRSRALVKTATYQTIATTLDFTVHYVVVGNLATAAMLSAFGLVVSPFIYFGHEMAWNYYGSPNARHLGLPTRHPGVEGLAAMGRVRLNLDSWWPRTHVVSTADKR
jgi:uncharacterized membrane protein